MSEVAAVPLNGYKVVSTFSGCGGTCLGFRMAGFKTVYASEFVAAARDTYEANHGFQPDPRDVREVTGASIRAMAGLAPDEELDVLEGSPPCASFSMSGSRAEHWGEVRKYSDTKQRTDDLFAEFARLLGELRPRVFVAENVAGLLRGVARGYFKEIHELLAAQGYLVRARLLDAQWLGVPQTRQRVILIGARADLNIEPVFPTPLPYRYSLIDALPHLRRVRQGRQGQFRNKGQALQLADPLPTLLATQPIQFEGVEVKRGTSEASIYTRPRSGAPLQKLSLDEPMPTVLASSAGAEVATMKGKIAQRFAVVDAETGYRLELDSHAIAPEYERLQAGQASERYFNLIRPDPSRPSPTLTASNNRRGVAGVAHPTEPRKFSIEELRRLCGFPDDFVLTGSYSQRWERLGRAVPPPMARAVAEGVRAMLDQAGGGR